MRDDLDSLGNTNNNIEEGNTEKNNDENLSDNFLKIDPIKILDSSNIKVEIPKTEIKEEVETTKKPINKQAKDKKEEPKTTEDNFQNDNKPKGNSKIIKIGIAVLILILCLGGGYLAYSKFMANNESEDLADNEENLEETPIEKTNTLVALGEPIVKNSQETIVEEEQQESEAISEEPIIKEQTVTQEENGAVSDEVTNNDNYDLVVLDTVYDEVINKGNEAYLNNFSSSELAIIRNTLYARRGYKFKKKIYQKYFGEKSWYNPTTSSQNILTKQEERLANIIKRYE